MSSTEKFAAIFDGLQLTGTFKIDKKQLNGKSTGRAAIVREPRSTEPGGGHISRQGRGIGIIPINEENKCVWGCIDVSLDHKKLIEQIHQLKLAFGYLSLQIRRSALLSVSTEWIEAKDIPATLQQMSALGYGGSEIFPKQIKLHLDRDDVGNFLNLPYFNAEGNFLCYAIKDDGTSATLDEFLKLYEQYKQTPEQIASLQLGDAKKEEPMMDGPPCLQILASKKIAEGGRNNGLFNLGVYLRKAYPDSWETEILTYNMQYLDPPLPLSEVNIVAKQLERKEYAYKCSDAPINAYCNKTLCLTRKHGVGAAVQGAVIANLRKYNSIPPVWFVDVNGEPLEMDTDALLNQAIFQKIVHGATKLYASLCVPNNMGEPYRGSNARDERKRKRYYRCITGR